MEKLYVQFFIWFLVIERIRSGEITAEDNETFNHKGYEIVQFDDDHTTVSRYFC